MPFALSHRSHLFFTAELLELRSRAEEALGDGAVNVEWSCDGGATKTLVCAAGKRCHATSAAALAPGLHVVRARLRGGVRPVARLWLEAEEGDARKLLGASYAVDYLAATPDSPVRISIQGPVVARLELRRPAGAHGSGGITVKAAAAGQEPMRRQIAVPSVRDELVSAREVGALSLPTLLEVPLPLPARYLVEIRPSGPLIITRVGLVEGSDSPETRAPAGGRVASDGGGRHDYEVVTDVMTPPIPFVYRSRTPGPDAEPLTLPAKATVVVRDGDVAPGWEHVGSLSGWTNGLRSSTNLEGAPVQTVTALQIGLTYRQLLDPLHVTVKTDAVERLNDSGPPSQSMGASLFFMHPEHRQLRLAIDGDGFSQPVNGHRQWAGRLALLVEPVVTIVPGLHLVTKLEGWWTARTLAGLGATPAQLVDPDLFNAYSSRHPRAIAWEEGLETEPFVNLVIYGNARVTTNPTLRPNDLDHLSTALFLRGLFGHTYAELLGRMSWFLIDGQRTRTATRLWTGTRLSHTFWPSTRNLIEVGTVLGYDFAVRAPEISVSVVWEGSNGRRFRDHSPREGEDYFFPERGPGVEETRVGVQP